MNEFTEKNFLHKKMNHLVIKNIDIFFLAIINMSW